MSTKPTPCPTARQLTPSVTYTLPADKYDAFVARLDEPAKDLPKLARLLDA